MGSVDGDTVELNDALVMQIFVNLVLACGVLYCQRRASSGSAVNIPNGTDTDARSNNASQVWV